MKNSITILGPRLQDIGGFDNKSVNNDIIKSILNILKKHPKSTLLTSASVGIEMWSAEAAVSLKIPIELVIPCNGFESKWPISVQKSYAIIRSQSKVTVLSEEPWSGKLMLAKDKYLHDSANIVYHFYGVTPKFIDRNKAFGVLGEIDNEFFLSL